MKHEGWARTPDVSYTEAMANPQGRGAKSTPQTGAAPSAAPASATPPSTTLANPPAASASPASAPSAAPAPADVVLLGPPTADGGGVHILRARNDRLEVGELRALREGQPVSGEIVALEPRAENPRICDVRASYVTPGTGTQKGPAQIATQAYRDRWDDIFGVGDRPAKRTDLN